MNNLYRKSWLSKIVLESPKSKLIDLFPNKWFWAKIGLKWLIWAIEHLQYPSFVPGPIDSTIHNRLEHYNIQNFNDCSPKSLSLPNWNIGMWKHGEYPIFLKYTRVSNEWGRNVLQAWSPIVADRLIAIEETYYRGKLVGISIEWATTSPVLILG